MLMLMNVAIGKKSSFFYGIAALGKHGANNVIRSLQEELIHAVRQHHFTTNAK